MTLEKFIQDNIGKAVRFHNGDESCTGLAKQWILEQYGVDLGDTKSTNQFKVLLPIDFDFALRGANDLLPGDLVFYPVKPGEFGHVGVFVEYVDNYLGSGQRAIRTFEQGGDTEDTKKNIQVAQLLALSEGKRGWSLRYGVKGRGNIMKKVDERMSTHRIKAPSGEITDVYGNVWKDQTSPLTYDRNGN